MYEFWTRQWYGVDSQTGAELYWASNTTASTAMVLKNGDTVFEAYVSSSLYKLT